VNELIPDLLDGQRVDRVIAMVADVPRSQAATLVADGCVSLDGRVVSTRSAKVAAGQTLEITGDIHAGPADIEPDPSVDVSFLHVDDDVFVIDKAAGQVVHPGAGNLMGTIAQGVLADHPEIRGIGEHDRPGVVHRLDKGTSGVFVMARSQRAFESLSEQLHDHLVDRRYLTIAWGHPEARDGLIEAPIGRAVRDPTRMIVREDGKSARTNYSTQCMWPDPAVSLISCVLETGRTHQIRVHLDAIGHSVLGDRRYGGGRTTNDIDRPALHAAELGFSHPGSGEWMEFSSPLPADMVGLMDGFGEPEWGQIP
jgi:23S rRNA pseudouridine1911/1915/1917 synthase